MDTLVSTSKLLPKDRLEKSVKVSTLNDLKKFLPSAFSHLLYSFSDTENCELVGITSSGKHSCIDNYFTLSSTCNLLFYLPPQPQHVHIRLQSHYESFYIPMPHRYIIMTINISAHKSTGLCISSMLRNQIFTLYKWHDSLKDKEVKHIGSFLANHSEYGICVGEHPARMTGKGRKMSFEKICQQSVLTDLVDENFHVLFDSNYNTDYFYYLFGMPSISILVGNLDFEFNSKLFKDIKTEVSTGRGWSHTDMMNFDQKYAPEFSIIVRDYLNMMRALQDRPDFWSKAKIDKNITFKNIGLDHILNLHNASELAKFYIPGTYKEILDQYINSFENE